jgi:aminoglycoside phosphotransferase (APT) family kinase protein
MKIVYAWYAQEGKSAVISEKEPLDDPEPTYYLATDERAYVLRRKRPGPLLPSAHASDREYRVLTALT